MAKPSKKIQSGSTDKVTRTGALRQPVKKVPLPVDDDLDDEVDGEDAEATDDADGSADTAGSGKAGSGKAGSGKAGSGKAGSGAGAPAKKTSGKDATAGKKGGVRKVDVKKKSGGKPDSKYQSKRVTPAASTRYTPPAAKFEEMPSPIWVPILMFSLFMLGMLAIFLNYVGLLPGATSNWYLLLGLGFILAGIITATQYR